MTELRTQSRLASFIEACANTVIGFCISVTAQWFMFILLGIKSTVGQFFLLIAAMTILSVVRSYCLRRMWNAEWWKRFRKMHPDKKPVDLTDPVHLKMVIDQLSPEDHARLGDKLRSMGLLPL